MIKILFFLETLEAGGAEKVLRDLVNNMDQTRFDITVQTVWPCDAKALLAPGIRYRSVFSAKNEANRFRYRAEAEAGLFYSLHIKGDYDIECAYIEMGPTKVMSSSTNRSAKKLAWVHCDLSGRITDRDSYVKKTEKQYWKFDEVICVSRTVEEGFRKLFGAAATTRVLYNVFEDAVIREKAQLPLGFAREGDAPVLAAVGRLSPEKGYDRLLRASSRLHAEGLDHSVWLIGDGPEREALEQLAKELNIDDCVRFFGFQSNPYPLIRAADVGVCSSLFEGFSTFAVECMILGKPFVTTECSGMREILSDSEYGLITDNEEAALYEGLKKMVADTQLRAEFSKKAKQRGCAFSTSNLVKETEDYFIKLAGN